MEWLYVITWSDGSREEYDNRSERSARLHKLETQGYTLGEDFTIDTEIDWTR